jgi:hypothetical protein
MFLQKILNLPYRKIKLKFNGTYYNENLSTYTKIVNFHRKKIVYLRYVLYIWIRPNRSATNHLQRIRCLSPDPGSGMGKKQGYGSGSGMNNPDHISLATIFGVKKLKFFYADPGSRMEKFGSGMEKSRNTTRSYLEYALSKTKPKL